MKTSKLAYPLILSAVVFALTGCGGSDSDKSAAKSSSAALSTSSSKGNTSVDHEAFERKYAEMCVNQELALRKKEHPTSGNAGDADPALTSLCACIAKEESKRVNAAEARKFVNENEYPFSLLIKAGQAEEVCAKK